MKNILHFLFSLIFLLASQQLMGQIDYPPNFQQQLQKAKVDFFEPTENSFKNLPIRKNDIQTYDLAIHSKKANVEIRYAIIPVRNNVLDDFPPINFTSKASSIATNQEDAHLVFHQMPDSDLKNNFNADWGASVFFQPKAAFSNRKHCKMVGLYAEGKANVYVFYLFDDLSIDLDQQLFNIRFLD